jgi:hypothetical protein
MAIINFEVECEVTGDVEGEAPDLTVSDIEITSVMMQVRTYNRTKNAFVTTGVDLLEGLNKAARDQVMANIIQAQADLIEESVTDDA